MRRTIIAALLTVVILAGGVAAQGIPADTPGPAQGGPPKWVDDWTNARPLDANQTDPDSLAGKMRVEQQYLNNTTVTLLRNDPVNFTMVIDVTGNASNVTFWVQTKAMEASQNINGLTAYIEGNQTEFYISQEGPGKWVQFVVPNFSERRITFKQVSNNIAPGPVQGRVRNAVAFAETTALTTGQVQPDNLSGKIRVSSEYAAQMNVTLTVNSTTEARLTMTHPNASNVTFYIQKQAIKASQNISNLSLYIDGRQRRYGVAQVGGGKWINYQVDQFSTKTATFTTAVVGGGITGFISDNLLLVGGAALAFVVLIGLFVYWRRASGQPEYVR